MSASHDDPSRRVALSPLQSAFEYTSSSPLCCQRNQHLARGFPARYRPILLTHAPCPAVRAWPLHLQVADPCDESSVPRDVTARECLAVTGNIVCHLRLVSVVTLIHVVPLVLGLCPSQSPSILPLAFIPCISLAVVFQSTWSRSGVCSFQLKSSEYLSDVSLIHLNFDAVTTPLR